MENELNELHKEYQVIDNEFDQVVLDVSKYRVKLEKSKKELHLSEKQFEEVQRDFNEVNSQLAAIEKNTETDEDSKAKQRAELDSVKNRSDDLKSIMAHQMDELNEKKKMYMNALRVKEYEIFRASNLCKEKARLTNVYETEFNQIKEYFKKRLNHTNQLPVALFAAQEQLAIQKEIKMSAEKTIEELQKKLKNIMGNENVDGDSGHKLRTLTMLKAKNNKLKSELEKLEKVSADIQYTYDETSRIANEHKSRLDKINTETDLKINKTRVFLNGLTEEYLDTLDKLQNEVSKIEAESCFEDEQLSLVNKNLLFFT
uniref:Uncharacterized protein n=1 Tax=Sipha flava TaxID=143950 RepID=A0A2S2RAA9_9HEMI